jgi:hypothetical protein
MRPRAYNGCRRTAESVRGMSVRAAATKLPATWQSCRPRGRQLYVLKPYGALDFVTRNSSCRPLFTHSKAFLPPRFVKEQQTVGHSLQSYMAIGHEDTLTPRSCRPIAKRRCGRQVGRQLVGNCCPRLRQRASDRWHQTPLRQKSILFQANPSTRGSVSGKEGSDHQVLQLAELLTRWEGASWVFP